MSENATPPSALDRYLDGLEHKALDFVVKLVLLLLALVLKPFAIATEVFFRKDFGERYLTFPAIWFASGLWTVAIAKSQSAADFGITFPHQQMVGYLVANLILTGFVGLAWFHFGVTLARRHRGEIWHSRSRGIGISGRDDFWRDFWIGVCITLLLGLAAPSCGVAFVVSRVIGWYLAYLERRAFYKRYLDTVDAQIESAHLQNALAQGLSPAFASGLSCSLPSGLNAQMRPHVARVIAGGPLEMPEAAAPAPSEPPRSDFTKAIGGYFAVLPPGAQKLLRVIYGYGTRLVAAVGGPKRLLAYVLAVSVIAAMGYVGHVAYRRHQQEQQARAKAKAAAEAKERRIKEAEETRAKLAAKMQPAPQPVAVASEPAPFVPPVAAAPVVAPPSPPKPDPAALLAAAKAEAAKAQAAALAKLQREREELVRQIKLSLQNHREALATFRTNCGDKLAANATSIQELSWIKRGRYKETNDVIFAEAKQTARIQQSFLDDFERQAMQQFNAPGANLSTVAEQFNRNASEMLKERDAIITRLDAHATAIANAASKRR